MGHPRRALIQGCVSGMKFERKDNIHLWCHSKGKEYHYFRLEFCFDAQRCPKAEKPLAEVFETFSDQMAS